MQNGSAVEENGQITAGSAAHVVIGGDTEGSITLLITLKGGLGGNH